MDPDRRFVLFTKSGNNAAFARLVRKYRDPVLLLVFDYLDDYKLAGNVAQKVFVKAFRHIREYDEKIGFSSWLYQIAVNDALEIRKSGGPDQKVPRVERTDTASRQAKNLPGRLPSNSSRDLKLLLNNLSESQLSTVILRYFHNKSIHEIAEILNCPENTVRIHLKDSLQTLSADLKNMKDHQ
jgi:RNA polymerase sigma-70 factor (ECF subfamily)